MAGKKAGKLTVRWMVGLHLRAESSPLVHPRKLTWNLKRMVSKRNLLFQGSIFRFHVSFRGSREWGNEAIHGYYGDETSLIPYFSGQLVIKGSWWLRIKKKIPEGSRRSPPGMIGQDVLAFLGGAKGFFNKIRVGFRLDVFVDSWFL